MVRPFAPDPGSGQSLTTAAASASVALNKDAKCVRVVNYGTTNPAYVRIGVGAQTAAAADLIVLPNSSIVVYKGDADTLAHIWNTGATTLHVQTGNGGA
jgi:hypothetical protein